jgi:outer membrane protein assembly factor BamB
MTNRPSLPSAVGLLAVLALLLALMLGAATAQSPEQPGSGPSGNAAGNAVFPGPGPVGTVDLAWELSIPDGYFPGAPVAYGEYLLMTATSEEFGSNLTVYELASGTFLWNHAAETQFSGPFVSGDAVYLTAGPRVIALSLTSGEPMWEALLEDGEPAIGDDSSFLVAENGVVFANVNSSMLALDGATGEEHWRRTFAGYDVRSPVLAGNVVVVSSELPDTTQARLHGISTTSGNEVWRRAIGSEGSPYYYAGSMHTGSVYLSVQQDTGWSGDILDAGNGQPLWNIDNACEASGSVTILDDTLACSGSMLDITSGEAWSGHAGIPDGMSPLAVVGDQLYVAASQRIIALDLATGAELWSYDFTGKTSQTGGEFLFFWSVSAGTDAVAVQITLDHPDTDTLQFRTYVLTNTNGAPAMEATPASPVATPAP